METRELLLVDAFAAEPTTGTPVGVVPNAAGLSDDQMRHLADEVGASETAFLFDTDCRLRFFSTAGERNHCAHGTIAAYAALFERDIVDSGEFSVATADGTLDGEVTANGTVWVQQGTATIREADLQLSAVADALGIDVATLQDVGADLPLAVVDAGTPWLLVPVNYFQHVSGIDPDSHAIDRLCETVGADGVYAFTFDTISGEATLHGRAFSPMELPATATAAGACGAYIRQQGAIDDTVEQVVVEQGQFLDRPGLVRVDTDGVEVWVGGRGVTTLSGTLTVPASDEDDDIIEL